jgi:competence ComEA-like helix-hairpin-helix protein
MKMKEKLAGYLTLSRKERTGVLLLGMLIISLFLLPPLLPAPAPPPLNPADTAWIVAMKKLEQKGGSYPQGAASSREDPDRPPARSGDGSPARTGTSSLFTFDPNTLGEAGWQQLGLREKTIKTILNYRSKGGKFRKPEDLQRVYGLFPDEYERLSPYIRIAESTAIPFPAWTPEKREGEKPAKASGNTRRVIVEINTADTSALIALPGIGSKLAQRIISFREKLGGFYAVSQVSETFGLADSVYRKIEPLLKLEVKTLRKININTATAEELKVHPYLKWNVINALLAFRKEHGPFRKKEELKQVMAVTDDLYQRVAPYLVTE